VVRPTEEYLDGSWVATTASFRVYHSVAESIADHSRLLATGESYQQAMANRQAPDAFANDLTGVYATDPNYGSSLIAIMRLYNLYRYDPTPSAPSAPVTTTPPVTTQVAAVDHPANLPGLEQVDAAFGGSAGLGTGANGSAAHGVPRPRGVTQVRTAREDRPRGGQGSGTAQSGRTQAATAPGGVALAASGRSGGRPGTPARSRTAHSGMAGSTPGLSGSASSGTAASRQGFDATTPGVTAGSGQGRGGTTGGSQGRGATTSDRQGRAGTTGSGPGRGAANGRPGLGGATGAGQGLGGARIPGLTGDYPAMPRASASAGTDAVRAARTPVVASASAGTDAVQAVRITAASSDRSAGQPAGRVRGATRPKRYEAQIPSVVTTDFVTMAKHPLARSKPLYQDVAHSNRIRWELLAACDWMQCRAQPQHSPVRGERLGSKNPDGTRFRTKSEALEQCAADLIVLADAVYQISLTAPVLLSVLELAQVFAAFRWGGLLKAHRISAMEFPYSVEGLTVQHLDLRWPDISEPNAPDRPGGRFKMPFGAVPVVLSLNYPAVT
jgi:hypothetical protein